MIALRSFPLRAAARLVAAGSLALALGAACADKQDAAPAAAKKTAGGPPSPGDGLPDWSAAFHHQERYDADKKAVVVAVDIAPGFHAYTTGEQTGKPLAVEILGDGDYVSDGDVVYPPGAAKDLPLGRSVIVEGKADIVARVKPKANAGGSAKGTLRYQVCTERACDRPRTVPFTVAVAP